MRVKIFSFLIIFTILTYSVLQGYAQDFSLNDSEKQYLLNLSRQTLYYYLKGKTVPNVDESDLTKNIIENRDCFVTLDKKGFGLRGCVGFGGQKPLYLNVIDRTIAAAIQDTRFPVVQYGELKDIKVDISVLTVPKELRFDSPDDLLNKIRAGVDGVIIRTRYGSSTYIPKVWGQIPEKEKFLSSLCRKHGAPMDTWKTDYKNMRVWTYQAIAFGEEIYGRRVVGKNGAVVGKKGAYVLGAVKPIDKGLMYGGYKLEEGTELAAGTIVSPDSDIIEN